MNLFIHSADIIAMKQTLTAEVRELRAALRDVSGTNNSDGPRSHTAATKRP